MHVCPGGGGGLGQSPQKSHMTAACILRTLRIGSTPRLWGPGGDIG